MNGVSDYCYAGIILAIAIFSIMGGIKLVPEYQRLVIFRLGRPLDKGKGPGLVFLFPMLDRALKVDLREQVREVSHQVSTSKDNVPISITFLWYYKILDPVKAVVAIGNFEAAAIGVATTILRSLISNLTVNDVLSQREKINTDLRAKLDETTGQWGVKVTNIEIREIIPSKEWQEAMKPQIIAERIQSLLGTLGETQTTVHTAGTILIGNKSWDAMSSKPIPPNSNVRIKRVIFEVEEDISTKAT